MSGTNEIRVVNQTTGGEKGSKAENFALLPWEQLAEVAQLYHFGAQKYSPSNWMKGYDWSLSFAAMMRHAAAWWSGEFDDAETGCDHMTSVVFHALALMYFRRNHPGLDDRPCTVIARHRAGQREEDVQIEPPADWPESHMVEAAWGIIANAFDGDWSRAPEDWRLAAEHWRDAMHAQIDSQLENGLEGGDTPEEPSSDVSDAQASPDGVRFVWAGLEGRPPLEGERLDYWVRPGMEAPVGYVMAPLEEPEDSLEGCYSPEPGPTKDGICNAGGQCELPEGHEGQHKHTIGVVDMGTMTWGTGAPHEIRRPKARRVDR